MVEDIMNDSPSIQEERKTLRQLNDKRHLEWNVMELSIRTTKEKTKNNLRIKRRDKGAEKIKTTASKKQSRSSFRWFNSRMVQTLQVRLKTSNAQWSEPCTFCEKDSVEKCNHCFIPEWWDIKWVSKTKETSSILSKRHVTAKTSQKTNSG